MEDDECNARTKDVIAVVANLIRISKESASNNTKYSERSQNGCVQLKLYVKFVPHVLTREQLENRYGSCQGLRFKSKFVTGYKTWCFAYSSDKERQTS